MKESLGVLNAQVIIAMNGKRVIEQLYSVRPDFVLIDIHLPDMSGFEILESIAEAAAERLVTVVFTSIDATREYKVMAYDKGAMDFIEKPLDIEIFVPYMLNRNEIRKTIEKFMITDGLTQVGNRRSFDDMLDYYVNRAEQSSEQKLFLVMIDIDYFKKVDDEFDHPAGDAVLKRLGQLVNAEQNDSIRFFRYGGEEFSVLMLG